MGTSAIEAENRNITDSQNQDLDKGIKMAKIIKCKLDRTQKSNSTWLVMTIKRLIIKPVNKFGPPVFSFKLTQEAARQSSQILTAFNVNLVASIESQKGSPMYYGSEF